MTNLDMQGPFGNTLLHSAAASGDVHEVRRLLALGADPGIRNREGQTPQRVADILGHEEIYGLLRRPDDALERRLDEALKETFPASDPIAVTPIKGR